MKAQSARSPPRKQTEPLLWRGHLVHEAPSLAKEPESNLDASSELAETHSPKGCHSLAVTGGPENLNRPFSFVH